MVLDRSGAPFSIRGAQKSEWYVEHFSGAIIAVYHVFADAIALRDALNDAYKANR